MNQIKIGKFISESRKSKEITQEQLAEKLGVSKNAVSKWERGLNLPDASIMQELCYTLGISLNELFAGERLKGKEIKKQSEKNLLEILKFSDDKNKKNKFLILITSALFIIAFATLGKVLLVKWGYILDSNLRYSQIYVTEYSNIKGNVDVNKFGKINIDFDIGANKYGYAVFKNPNKAFNRLKKDYSKGIELIRKEFNLLPLNNFTYKNYKTYGWQVTTGTAEEKEQARFVSSFLDIYNNSFSQ